MAHCVQVCYDVLADDIKGCGLDNQAVNMRWAFLKSCYASDKFSGSASEAKTLTRKDGVTKLLVFEGMLLDMRRLLKAEGVDRLDNFLVMNELG